MTTTPRIILNNLSFYLEETPVFFERINLSFEAKKYGVVGPNGVGKSTFLKLLLGVLTPDTGSINTSGHIMDVPQLYAAKETISHALGVYDILEASARIQSGQLEENDFERMTNHWDIEKRIEDALTRLNIWPVDLGAPFNILSGGQKTKILLAKTLIFPSDFLILDEPTNNLDKASRHILYDYIENTEQSVIIVSHDRALLNKLDRIIEINTKNIEVYGGNYDFYHEQKITKQRALDQAIQTQTDILNKSKKTIQTRMERHQQNESRSYKARAKEIKGCGSYDKLSFKAKKGRSENTNRRIRGEAVRKLASVNQTLEAVREKQEVQEKINLSLLKTHVPNSKIILEIEMLGFSYHDFESAPLIKNLNFKIMGPERVAITGPNGCGKSSLIQLIKGDLNPNRGLIKLGMTRIAYLDQKICFLESDLTLVENFLKLNPDSKTFDAYSALAAFKFRNKEAEKKVSCLSGGERMRAGLAITLMSACPPQLLILDEPTNHLDLESIEAIEEALVQYQGAILGVSHDESFLENINIQRSVDLS